MLQQLVLFTRAFLGCVFTVKLIQLDIAWVLLSEWSSVGGYVVTKSISITVTAMSHQRHCNLLLIQRNKNR